MKIEMENLLNRIHNPKELEYIITEKEKDTIKKQTKKIEIKGI
ncbi:unnamed protein product [marine sediment metagenome]|uniref:Uncharacterized protein n=1 Tax=marine sediment metagenome TaxID=412755 RepID=X1DNB1_9ZZZZ